MQGYQEMISMAPANEFIDAMKKRVQKQIRRIVYNSFASLQLLSTQKEIALFVHIASSSMLLDGSRRDFSSGLLTSTH
jgi:hypothetical protein